MDSIEEKLALFRLGEKSVQSVLHTLDLVRAGQKEHATYTVETVVIRNGKAEVVSKEDKNV